MSRPGIHAPKYINRKNRKEPGAEARLPYFGAGAGTQSC